jgi:hypothetical protein
MEKVLQLVFKDGGGEKKTISIAEPREDITAEEAKAAMTAIIAANVFVYGGSALSVAVEARYRTIDYTILS